MWILIKDFVRFLRRRDSESMSCLMIGGAQWLTDRDMRDLRDYFAGLLEYREKWGEED